MGHYPRTDIGRRILPLGAMALPLGATHATSASEGKTTCIGGIRTASSRINVLAKQATRFRSP